MNKSKKTQFHSAPDDCGKPEWKDEGRPIAPLGLIKNQKVKQQKGTESEIGSKHARGVDNKVTLYSTTETDANV